MLIIVQRDVYRLLRNSYSDYKTVYSLAVDLAQIWNEWEAIFIYLFCEVNK